VFITMGLFAGNAQAAQGMGMIGRTHNAPVCGLKIRRGDESDGPAVIAMFDEAIAWLVERGQTGQWGATPFSERPGIRERVYGFRVGGGLHIAELKGKPVGVLVVGPAPAYAPAAPVPELYIILLISSRQLTGRGIGAALLN
jgi:hypothetical protein